mmetsp:Transcript_24294/g.54297  ORF Transcript_24294/g.54297 Transcript_24294/m.54297 type:complete len:488 (+) Transcript_24294:944-2407(+)
MVLLLRPLALHLDDRRVLDLHVRLDLGLYLVLHCLSQLAAKEGVLDAHVLSADLDPSVGVVDYGATRRGFFLRAAEGDVVRSRGAVDLVRTERCGSLLRPTPDPHAELQRLRVRRALPPLIASVPLGTVRLRGGVLPRGLALTQIRLLVVAAPRSDRLDRGVAAHHMPCYGFVLPRRSGSRLGGGDFLRFNIGGLLVLLVVDDLLNQCGCGVHSLLLYLGLRPRRDLSTLGLLLRRDAAPPVLLAVELGHRGGAELGYLAALLLSATLRTFCDGERRLPLLGAFLNCLAFSVPLDAARDQHDDCGEDRHGGHVLELSAAEEGMVVAVLLLVGPLVFIEDVLHLHTVPVHSPAPVPVPHERLLSAACPVLHPPCSASSLRLLVLPRDVALVARDEVRRALGHGGLPLGTRRGRAVGVLVARVPIEVARVGVGRERARGEDDAVTRYEGVHGLFGFFRIKLLPCCVFSRRAPQRDHKCKCLLPTVGPSR